MDAIDLKDQLDTLLKGIQANTLKMEFISAKLDQVNAALDGFIVNPVTALDSSSPTATTSMVSRMDVCDVMPPSSGQSSVTTHTTELVSESPPRCARPTIVHDICHIPDAATPLCAWGVCAPSRGAPPAPECRLVASLELDKRTPTRCLVLGASASLNDKSMTVDAPVNDTDEHLALLPSSSSSSGQSIQVSVTTVQDSLTVTPAGPESIIVLASMTCSAECPSHAANELTHASTPAAASMMPKATVDVIVMLTATTASDGTFDDEAIKGAASRFNTGSPGSPHSGVYASVGEFILSAPPSSLSSAPTAPTPWPPPYQYLSGCDSNKSRPAPWPSFGDLPGGMHLPEPMPQLQKSEEGVLGGMINRDNEVAVQHILDSVSGGVRQSSFGLFQWKIAGQLGGSANYASNNRTGDGKEVLLTWSHFLRIQILALTSKEISFEIDLMSVQRYTSISTGNCFRVEWFNGILLQAYLLSQFIRRVTSCGFELLQWQIAWSHHRQCSEITSAKIKEHLLPDMSEQIILATFMSVCYLAVGWSILSTIVRLTEESILIDSMKRNKSTRSCQTLILAFPLVTTKIAVDSELLYYYQAYTFRTAAALELQQSMYKLFSEGTCPACKVKSYRKFFDPVIVNLGHLSSLVIQHAIHGASHCDGVDFCSSFPMCTDMWMGQSKENGELIQWLPKNQQWKIPWKMSGNCSLLPSSNSFTAQVARRVTCETMSIVQLSSEPLGHPLDVIRTVKWHGTSLIEKNLVMSQYKAHRREAYSMFRVAPPGSGLFTQELMLGRGRLVRSPEHELTGRGKQAGTVASTQQAGQPVVLCSPLLDHYWRAGQYRDSMNILGHKWTPESKHWCALWDPGGGILQVFADCGLRASRKLRRGECHVPTITWAVRWTGPVVSKHTRNEPALRSCSLVSMGYIRGKTPHDIGIEDQISEHGSPL